MTPSDLKRKLETKQAKEWGYKSIKESNDDGYNVTRVNCTVSEMSDVLKISDTEARRMKDEWKYNGLIKFVAVCGLDQIIFI